MQSKKYLKHLRLWSALSLLTHLFQSVHQPRQSAQGFQVTSSLVGLSDEPMEGVIHAVVEFGGRGESSPDKTEESQSLLKTRREMFLLSDFSVFFYSRCQTEIRAREDVIMDKTKTAVDQLSG